MADDPRQGLLPAYLVVVKDVLKREKVIERLESHLDPSLLDFNLERIEASSDVEPVDFVAGLQTLPFGEGFRLVELSYGSGLASELSDAVIDYLDDPNPACVLLLVGDSQAKNTRLYKAVNELGPKAVIECEPPQKSRDLSAFVQKLVTAQGRSIDVPAANELVSRVGDSTVMLERTVKTLCELLPSQTRFSRSDVVANVARVVEVKPFELVDAMATRNFVQAMDQLRAMENPPYVLLHTLFVRRLRELICARSLSARGRSASVAAELKLPPNRKWMADGLVRDSRRFGDGELERLLGEAVRLEETIKGSGDEYLALTRFLKIACVAGE